MEFGSWIKHASVAKKHAVNENEWRHERRRRRDDSSFRPLALSFIIVTAQPRSLVFYFSSVFFCFFCLHHVNKVWSLKREMRFFAGSEREREPMYAIEQSQKKKTREICCFFVSCRVNNARTKCRVWWCSNLSYISPHARKRGGRRYTRAQRW